MNHNTHDDNDDNFISNEIDAYIVEINALEITNIDAPWYFDNHVTRHVSRNQKIFTSL